MPEKDKGVKFRYYNREKNIIRYISLRYGGEGGRYINEMELKMVERFLDTGGLTLDMPSGTGRISGFLIEKGVNRIFGMDYSFKMLGYSKKRIKIKFLCGDAFSMPFKDNSFSQVISMRFFFHYKDIYKLLKEIWRVLKKEGVVIFETYRWSPLLLNIPFLGGKNFIHTDSKILKVAEASGFVIERKEGKFLFSPFIYRWMPGIIIRFLDKLERIVPDSFKYASFWKLKKVR